MDKARLKPIIKRTEVYDDHGHYGETMWYVEYRGVQDGPFKTYETAEKKAKELYHQTWLHE